jgi:hypothetical protein
MSEECYSCASLKREARDLHIEVDLMLKNFTGLGPDLFNALRSIERSLLAMYDERERERAALASSLGGKE